MEKNQTPSDKDIKKFSNKYGYFACYEKTKEYLQLTFKYHNLNLRYYYK